MQVSHLNNENKLKDSFGNYFEEWPQLQRHTNLNYLTVLNIIQIVYCDDCPVCLPVNIFFAKGMLAKELRYSS